MSDMLYLEPWWRFGVALLIGALIGLEREFVQQRMGEQDFAGIRTFSLMALLGAIGAHLSKDFGLLPFLAVYVGLILLVWASYIGEVFRQHEEGITTEVVALIVPLLGGMVIWGEFELASALAVITALVLALKPTLHNLARRMSAKDLRATLEFAIITAVVLPLLPNNNFGPFNVLNPRLIWLLVVLVSGIGFLGYVLIKILGAEQGVGVTGVLGGLVSSTATTVSFSGRSKGNPELSPILTQGILLTSSVMFPRVMVEVAVVYPPLLGIVVVPILAMLAVSLGLVFFLRRSRRGGETEERKEVDVSNPLRLTTAITFALAFVVVLIVVRVANELFGDAGVYIASAITGVTDVDAITLSASELASFGQIQPHVAGLAIILATLVNTVAKGVMAWVLGSKELRRTIVRAFGIVLLTGIVSSVIVFRGGV
ncbi:MAG: DUF4010 domain-containing protein [Anaerolineales bacterium]|nr:DUF4010 domain-containing protein [Anaerolineales bacterium]